MGWISCQENAASLAAMTSGTGSNTTSLPASAASARSLKSMSVTLNPSKAMLTSTAAMQTLAPNQMRAQISAVFLLVSNLIGLGIGTTLVALLTDKVFGSPLAVGNSMSIVSLVAALLATVLLGFGCRQFRLSLEREESQGADVTRDAQGAAAALSTTRA